MTHHFNFSNLQAINPCHTTLVGDKMILRSQSKVDFFRKYKGTPIDNAAFFYQMVSGNFSFHAQVKIDAHATYDAIFLMVRAKEEQWIKLALELGSDRQYNVVSVITNKWSDDANGELITTQSPWLRITRVNNIWGLHYSLDGIYWRFVRTFGFELDEEVMVGYGVQSPRGEGFESEISHLQLNPEPILDFRSGK
ncbi:DUF1349 domain-containing protein [Sphingobacterium sp. SRCM116780]|uniref:DUF1349 domain-containing protein n=1 Tax=Sphingobacterium sp. SRCM116780 TaxID=2907623 RepID=UPI001F36DB1F|nr:DUF1349 domain-containing protein [Sphingobacterium sp. SRCM116780]UIR54908.1 DUF1349 domain-containing protein [Sphingobacterium sp. SRCM116780]